MDHGMPTDNFVAAVETLIIERHAFRAFLPQPVPRESRISFRPSARR
jgi:hypothetical protein